MNTPKSIALFKCGAKGLCAFQDKASWEKSVSKVYIHNNEDTSHFRLHFPHAEFVDKKELILRDTTIDHVIIFDPTPESMHLVAEVLQAGKNVQILTN